MKTTYEKNKMERLYKGISGEHHIISLFYREGHHANKRTIDDGIDLDVITQLKNGSEVHNAVQVKTAKLYRENITANGRKQLGGAFHIKKSDIEIISKVKGYFAFSLYCPKEMFIKWQEDNNREPIKLPLDQFSFTFWLSSKDLEVLRQKQFLRKKDNIEEYFLNAELVMQDMKKPKCTNHYIILTNSAQEKKLYIHPELNKITNLVFEDEQKKRMGLNENETLFLNLKDQISRTNECKLN